MPERIRMARKVAGQGGAFKRFAQFARAVNKTGFSFSVGVLQTARSPGALSRPRGTGLRERGARCLLFREALILE